MRGFLQRLFGGGNHDVTNRTAPRKAESYSGETIRAGEVPKGDEVRKHSAPHWIDIHTQERPDDHLGNAAVAKHEAKRAIRERRYDDAWGHLHEQQSEWLKHAARGQYTPQQTLSLLSSIHEDMANILRLEGRHDEGLAHMIYCLASNSRPTQSQQKKLGAYFRRCDLKGVSDSCAEEAVASLQKKPDFHRAQELVKGWRKLTEKTGPG